MTIQFYIRFSSRPGENLVLRLYDKNESEQLRFPMRYLNPDFWHLDIEEGDLLTSTMVLYDGVVEQEGVPPKKLFALRKFDLRKIHKDHVEIYDEAEPGEHLSKLFDLPAFRILALPKNRSAKRFADKNYTVAFNVFAPALPAGKILCITGSGKKLRHWDTEKPIPLYRKAGHWSIKLSLPATRQIEYKFVVYDTIQNKITEWEDGENRVIKAPDKKRIMVLFQYARLQHYPAWKGAGIQVPVFSLSSESDWGIGQITALKPLINWADEAGFSMIQLLPILDTTVTHTRKDSYPYAPISAFALHPLLLDIGLMAKNSGIELPETLLLQTVTANRSDKVNLDLVYDLKWQALQLIYEKEKSDFHDDLTWFSFFDMNREWLVPYAAYCCLRDKFGTADFAQWGSYTIFDQEKIDDLVSPHSADYDAVSFYYFLQFHLHLQLQDVCDHAKRKQVILKGDLTVGVNRNSVDTWMYPHYFDLETDYGAPPDGFTAAGQNWKFPVYNMPAHEKDGYAWWHKRLEHAEKYFQAIRIDHVLGFFRMFGIPHASGDPREGVFIPAIPLQAKDFADAGLPLADYWCERSNTDGEVVVIKKQNGYHLRAGLTATKWFLDQPDYIRTALQNLYHRFFFEDQNALWKENGTKFLSSLINKTSLLVCAEDLGMVPHFLPELLEQMHIPGLRVQRMPLATDEKFFRPQQAPYLSVVTTGTHDMRTLREWWETEREDVQLFFNTVLGHHGPAPYFCEVPLVKKIVGQHLHSPAMLAIFPIQDILAMHEGLRRPSPQEERINDPGNPDHEWNFRLHLTVEDLAEQGQFQEHLADMVLNAGR